MEPSGTAADDKKLVRDNPPGELRKINAEKLAGMGVSESLADAFLDNRAFDPQAATILTGSLELLGNAKGRDQFVAAAALASGRSTALLYQSTAQMMAGFHARVAPAKSIERVQGTPYLRTKDDKAVFLLPMDFVFGTEEVQAKLGRLDDALEKAGGIAGKELWVTGQIDGSAMKMLEASGWESTGKSRSKTFRERRMKSWNGKSLFWF